MEGREANRVPATSAVRRDADTKTTAGLSAEPVVLVRGSLGSSQGFQRQFEALSSSFLVAAFSR
jgi:hypothetical protein